MDSLRQRSKHAVFEYLRLITFTFAYTFTFVFTALSSFSLLLLVNRVN